MENKTDFTRPRSVQFFFAEGSRQYARLQRLLTGDYAEFFGTEAGSVESINTAAVTEQIKKLYHSYTDNALKIAEGDFIKSDYILNCSAYEYFYRLRAYNAFVEWNNKKLKGNTTNTEDLPE